MDKEQAVSQLVLPEIKERKGFLVYLKIVFIPCFIYALALLVYFGYIDFKIELATLVLMGFILFIALILAKHNAEYASSAFEQQGDEFKQALKSYIMKNFLKVGREVKSNASFDDFANAYVAHFRSENFATIASTLFATLGILGTFISIALFMPSFNTSDLNSLEWAISQFLSGVSNAFYIAVYGIFLSLWWVFFERFGRSKIEKLLYRQKNSTSGFFWSKEELEQRYFTQGLRHFDKIGVIFEQVSSEDFFKELNHSIERKFGLFQEMLSVEEKAIHLSSEHIKQNMNELHRAQKNQKDLSRVYLEMSDAIASLQQSLKDINVRMSEQYNHLLSISNERIAHLDKTLATLDERIENFKRSFGYYQDLMLSNQEKIFMGFKQSLIQGMKEFKEAYEDEKHIDGSIELMSKLKADITQLDNEASEVITKLKEEYDSSKQ